MPRIRVLADDAAGDALAVAAGAPYGVNAVAERQLLADPLQGRHAGGRAAAHQGEIAEVEAARYPDAEGALAVLQPHAARLFHDVTVGDPLAVADVERRTGGGAVDRHAPDRPVARAPVAGGSGSLRLRRRRGGGHDGEPLDEPHVLRIVAALPGGVEVPLPVDVDADRLDPRDVDGLVIASPTGTAGAGVGIGVGSGAGTATRASGMRSASRPSPVYATAAASSSRPRPLDADRGAARRFLVSRATVAKWVRRYRTRAGPTCTDRCSRPRLTTLACSACAVLRRDRERRVGREVVRYERGRRGELRRPGAIAACCCLTMLATAGATAAIAACCCLTTLAACANAGSIADKALN